LINGTFALTVLYLRKREKIEIVAVKDQVAFKPMKSTSPVAITLDPRSERQDADELNESSQELRR